MKNRLANYLETLSVEDFEELTEEQLEEKSDVDAEELVDDIAQENYNLHMDNINRTLGLVASLEKLSDRYLKKTKLSALSLENYRVSVEALFVANGFPETPAVLVPSLEDADPQATGMGRAKEAVTKVINFLKDLFKKLYERLKSAFQVLTGREDSLKATQEKVRETLTKVQGETILDLLDNSTDLRQAGNIHSETDDGKAVWMPGYMVSNGSPDIVNYRKTMESFFNKPGILVRPTLISKYLRAFDGREVTAELADQARADMHELIAAFGSFQKEFFDNDQSALNKKLPVNKVTKTQMKAMLDISKSYNEKRVEFMVETHREWSKLLNKIQELLHRPGLEKQAEDVQRFSVALSRIYNTYESFGAYHLTAAKTALWRMDVLVKVNGNV